jgi:tryptophan-rich sensory protein
MNSKLKNSIALAIWIIIAELAGILGSIFTFSAIPSWYATLVKPSLNPPSFVFGPVWTILYALMGVAAFLVWSKGWHRPEVKKALAVFGLQLILNALWSIIFFGMHSITGGLIEIAVLWAAIVWTIILFYKISRPAAYLLVPYLAWVTFASYLTYTLYRLN